jgi:uncharacterized cupin superfamily protein
MPKLDLASIAAQTGSGYPAPFDEPCRNRTRQRLGDAGGLTDFGVNLLTLTPGTWSSQRHWHSDEDEFVYVVSGEAVLISDAGEEVLRAGDCAAFPKGEADGHHLVNKSDAPCVCLEIGTRSQDDVALYPDVDLKIDAKRGHFTKRDGTPYPVK